MTPTGDTRHSHTRIPRHSNQIIPRLMHPPNNIRRRERRRRRKIEFKVRNKGREGMLRLSKRRRDSRQRYLGWSRSPSLLESSQVSLLLPSSASLEAVQVALQGHALQGLTFRAAHGFRTLPATTSRAQLMRVILDDGHEGHAASALPRAEALVLKYRRHGRQRKNHNEENTRKG